MAVGMLTETPGVTPALYDQVNAKMGVEGNPPEGLIVHTAGFAEGNLIVFDVWESREAFERFESERLRPAIQEVAGGTQPPRPRQKIYELHDLARP